MTKSIQSGNQPLLNTDKIRKHFVAVEPIADLTRKTMTSFVAGFGQGHLSQNIRFDVKSYSITYRTTFREKVIEVSGLLIIPQDVTEPCSILSIQHGTTFTKAEAPSRSSYSGMELFAAAGYVVVVPDYIGYGESSGIFHPYYDKDLSACTVVDLIKATKEFLLAERVLVSEEVFLAGYSEGGYVTLAAAAAIEQNGNTLQIKLSGVAAGAGGYDLNHMLQSISTDAYYSYPAYLAFVLMAYNETYNWNKPLDYFFRPQFAQSLREFLNGRYHGAVINNKLTKDLTKLFTENFYQNLRDPEGEIELKKRLNQNSIKPWQTTTPIRLYHGGSDEVIPVENSRVVLRAFQNAGATDILLKEFKGNGHAGTLFPMMQDFLPWLLQVTKKKNSH